MHMRVPPIQTMKNRLSNTQWWVSQLGSGLEEAKSGFCGRLLERKRRWTRRWTPSYSNVQVGRQDTRIIGIFV
jgi:hypothetical protein